MFRDGACPFIKERDEGKWSIRLFSLGHNFRGDWPPGGYLLFINKRITEGKPWYNITWNANCEGIAAYNSAQWTLGEDFQFDGKEDFSSFTISNDLVKLEVKPISSLSKAPYVLPLIIEDYVGSVSDKGVIIQSVDLLNAQRGNH